NTHASQCLLSNRSADHNESDIRPELLSITYSLDNVQRHNRHVKIMGKQACQGPHTEHEGASPQAQLGIRYILCLCCQKLTGHQTATTGRQWIRCGEKRLCY
ncbi:unnamed protein product, partial [Fusarium graminearum]